MHAHVLEAINSAIEEIMLPTIQNVLSTQNANSNAKLDLRSDEPHQSENGGMNRKTRVDFLKLKSAKNNHNFHLRESSVDS